MKGPIVFFLTLLLQGTVYGQQWRSIPRHLSFKESGTEQFLIDPYSGNMWFNAGYRVSVIEPDGTIKLMTGITGEITYLNQTGDLQFAFTPSHTYFAFPEVGLYTFDNYSEQLVYNLDNTNGFLENISTNGDTVYMAFDPVPFSYAWTYLKYTPSSTLTTGKVCDLVVAKETQKYFVRGDSFLFYSNSDELLEPIVYLIHSDPADSDPDYIDIKIRDLKFQNIGDTLAIAGNLGISLIYNNDVLPLNYTPNNTTNMPSAKVLEIEFDESDSLWAVFGDDNKDPIAIAKLDGTNWTSIFTQSNSPINFDWFVSMEFDSAGNIWVNDDTHLHTLVAPTNPTWLSTIENERIEFSVAPNPSSGSFTLSTPLSSTADQIGVVDMMGRTLVKTPYATDLHLNLQKGVYLLQLIEGNAILGSERIVIK